MSCSVRRLHITNQRVAMFVSKIASKCCDTQIFVVCISVEHAAKLACGQDYPGCIFTLCWTSKNRNFSRAMKLFVEEPDELKA